MLGVRLVERDPVAGGATGRVGQRPHGVDHLEATPARATGEAADRPWPAWLGGFLLIVLFAQLLVEWRRAHRTTTSEVPA